MEGSSGITLRVHMSYNLKVGCMDEIKVTDNHIADSTFPLRNKNKKRDIYRLKVSAISKQGESVTAQNEAAIMQPLSEKKRAIYLG